MLSLQSKIKSLKSLIPIVRRLRRSGKKIITTNGCFDIIHVGHVKNLEWAKSKGDVLVVGINSDSSVRKLKGRRRPIIPAGDRAQVLAGLDSVDYVFIFQSISPISWLKELKPDIHIKGKHSVLSDAFLPEKLAVNEWGGRVILAPQIKERSTTNIVDRILKLHEPRRKR